ncbi:SDR family oxidoreductase [Phycisphaera mikurensis]|uniref:Putative glucose 1-dehydrogenase n=1 Tax=Phycisphaera mikurensis (strain NBRC 102666 / KCTC 22515 / FYK2301M01) TaxID=1142394 RepID=I0IDR9_PHYMF|nr:SDR family oxidoreductase [Phycisphaera mikurensis]MBB6441220.1 NAD(P)-dependent dehydrogenase (short-subunit alcohol dehydrogenase family) [Phycisphaera mikurensis]BAM03407.1 putative glucose 1-dehydrogenase [Phycisphaera mikurensis NBRC 102666]
MHTSLKNRRVLVTGGSAGIGQAIARSAARAGADVAFNHLGDDAGAAETADLIEGFGRRCWHESSDIAEEAQVIAMFRKLDEAWGGIDILVNNAGVDGHRGLLWEMDPAEIRRVLDINFHGVIHACRSAVPRMIGRGHGVICNITSVHDKVPWSGYTPYCAAKAAVAAMTQSMTLELADSGVRAFCIAPGAIKTNTKSHKHLDEAAHNDLLSKIPSGRVGNAEEVGDMVVALCSPAGDYVAGTSVYVDGGMTCYPSFMTGG